MYWEASGNVDKAVELYNQALEDKPTDDLILKRLVGLSFMLGPNQLTSFFSLCSVWFASSKRRCNYGC